MMFKIYNNFIIPGKLKKSILLIGNFDGLHLGHQKIIDELIENSKIKNCLSAILSFKPHPRQFFSDKYFKQPTIDLTCCCKND